MTATWLVLALVLVAALAAVLWIARDWRGRSAAAFLLAAGAFGYVALGRPDIADQPYDARLEALAAIDPEQLRGDQAMALLKRRAREAPDDPRPVFLTGQIYAAAGERDQAVFAYQSALRRDAGFVPAMKALADLLFMSSGGQVGEDALRLYRRAFELQPDDLRVGYMAALGDWQAGNREQAEAEFARLSAGLAAEDPRLQMFKALREAFATEGDPPALPPEP